MRVNPLAADQVTVPQVGRSSPAIRLSSVDFPLPDGPMIGDGLAAGDLRADVRHRGQPVLVIPFAHVGELHQSIHAGTHRRMTLLALLAGAIVITAAYPQATTQVAERYTPLLVLLPTLAVGNMTRMWRERADDSAERLRLIQAAHEAETRHALETERARIASELHDVVTHNVSVMVIARRRAGCARRLTR